MPAGIVNIAEGMGIHAPREGEGGVHPASYAC